MSAEEKNKLLLQHYNDLRHEEERKEYPCKLIMLLRIALRLRNLREEMYKFPLQEYVQETSKILLINEYECAFWYHLMKTYLTRVNGDAVFTMESVKLFFFQSAMFVKYFLHHRALQTQRPFFSLINESEQTKLQSIEAYIKAYHFTNFDDVYASFDRDTNYLLSPDHDSATSSMSSGTYESRCYLINLRLAKINRIMKKLRQPIETDEKRNLIDYNW